MDTLVSIVIPCFNAASTVRGAILSALAQSYAPVEVIVVDDGSTDESLRVIRSFGNRVRYLTGPNAGAAAARNKGAALAQGQLLQFLDADDRLYPNKLERQVPLAIARRPGMVFCNADVVDGRSGMPKGSWRTGAVSTADALVHALRVTVQTSGPLHWRESFESVGGFRADTPPCDDRDLHLRLACCGVPFHYFAEALYVMRRFEGSLSNRNPLGGLQMQLRVGEDTLDRLGGLDTLSSERRLAFATYFASTGRAALRLGGTDLGLACFRRAREIHPDGGVSEVYSRYGGVAARLLGPIHTERLASYARALRGHRSIA